MLSTCYNFANEGLKSYSENYHKIYLNNRRFYYFGKGLLKMRDSLQEDFKTKAIGYGKMIAYTGLAKDAFSTG